MRTMERVVNATEFKSRCLAFLSEMEQRGETLTITRRGHPVAILSPAPKSAWKSPANSWAGKGKIDGDIVGYDASQTWNVVGEQ